MACIGLLGCKHLHKTIVGYILTGVVIAAVVLGLRCFIYVVRRWMQRCREDDSMGGVDHGVIEMHGGRPVPLFHQQQWRREAACSSVVATTAADEDGD